MYLLDFNLWFEMWKEWQLVVAYVFHGNALIYDMFTKDFLFRHCFMCYLCIES